MNQTHRPSFSALLGALAVVLALSGCTGASGPQQYTLSGTVLYNGKPVPVGEITLEPDGSHGNSGPGCLALIKDGKYETEPGKGIVGGAYVVRIVGFDGVPVGEATEGTGLFPPYETRIDFPHQSTTHEFTIPVSSGRRSHKAALRKEKAPGKPPAKAGKE